MSIRINQERCIGCGQCIDVCPGSLIDRDLVPGGDVYEHTH